MSTPTLDQTPARAIDPRHQGAPRRGASGRGPAEVASARIGLVAVFAVCVAAWSRDADAPSSTSIGSRSAATPHIAADVVLHHAGHPSAPGDGRRSTSTGFAPSCARCRGSRRVAVRRSWPAPSRSRVGERRAVAAVRRGDGGLAAGRRHRPGARIDAGGAPGHGHPRRGARAPVRRAPTLAPAAGDVIAGRRPRACPPSPNTLAAAWWSTRPVWRCACAATAASSSSGSADDLAAKLVAGHATMLAAGRSGRAAACSTCVCRAHRSLTRGSACV